MNFAAFPSENKSENSKPLMFDLAVGLVVFLGFFVCCTEKVTKSPVRLILDIAKSNHSRFETSYVLILIHLTWCSYVIAQKLWLQMLLSHLKKKKQGRNKLPHIWKLNLFQYLVLLQKKKKHIYNKEKKRSLLMPYLKISLSNVKYKLEWKDIIHWTDYD